MHKRIAFLMVLCILLGALPGGARAALPASNPPTIVTYADIPGITSEEIAAIEALKLQNRVFNYGTLLSTESFLLADGSVSGYTDLLCSRLSTLFGLEFKPRIYDWDQIIDGLADGTIDFCGDLIPTDERRQKYFMTGAIAERSINIFTLRGAEDIFQIAKQREPRLGFLAGSVHLNSFQAVYTEPFETVYVDSFEVAAEKLEDGSIDGFINESVSDTYFESDYVESEEFFPLTYIPVSLTTQNPELSAIISATDKYLENGGHDELASLYAEGSKEYRHHHLFSRFSAEELAYVEDHVQNGKPVPIALEFDNYPNCFYNVKDQEYQGTVPDVLREITSLTGLEFEAVNSITAPWPEIFDMLKSGKVAMVSELLYSNERQDQNFLWTTTPYSTNYYALLSKSDYPDIEIYQVLSQRIGVIDDTAYEELFKTWFPSTKPSVYPSVQESFSALERGEIDVLMASENLLLSQTNYYEKPNYKVNIRFNYPSESRFGFGPDQGVLRSVIDKSQSFVATDHIEKRWVSKVFDYASELNRTRVLFLLISVGLLVVFLGIVVVFLVRNRQLRFGLEATVKERTKELESVANTLSVIYNSIPDLVFCKDINSVYISCNPSFEQFSGMSEKELVGKCDMDLRNVDAQTAAEFIQDDQYVLNSGSKAVFEERVTYPDGSKRTLETIKTPLKKDGQVIGLMGISRDVTERKAIEDAAQEANKAKSSFLARMSHEIRTPLNAIIGMTEIVKASVAEDTKTLSSLNQIMTSSRHLLGIINDVLDMSKIESDKLELSSEAFSLPCALQEVSSMIEPKCSEKRIAFNHNISELQDLTIVGDKLRLNQILINLLGNAVKFTPEAGVVALRVDVLKEDEDSATIAFSVADNGIGMTGDQLARLFTPFEQADHTIASRFGGTGLGLSISKTLIEMMGGEICANSEYGCGSTFSFELVFQKGELGEALEESEPLELDLQGFRILLAEDIEINRYILIELLSETGAEIDEATNGAEAVRMFREAQAGHYQLVFMDIQMPELDGYSATAQIRALERVDAKCVPIIAMTANVYKEDIEQALAAGMNAHLAKPIDVAELMKTLRLFSGGDRNKIQ